MRIDDGETITDLPERTVVLLRGDAGMTLTWSRYAAGSAGPDLHVHRAHTDAFYVLEGELTFIVGPRAERVRAPAGTFVAVPPGVVHTFANESDAEARWLNMHAPDGGFAAFMRGARDGVAVPWDSFAAPDDGGLPPDGIVVRSALGG
jgi:quercetin dioxygenase-like cupin family protein